MDHYATLELTIYTLSSILTTVRNTSHPELI